MHLMAQIGDVFRWRLISVCLEIVLTSTQDRCMVCAKYTIGSEIILDAPLVLRRDVGQVEPLFSPFGDSVNLDAR